MALDGWNTIKATVEGLTHRQLVTVGKALRAPAGLGFDPQKLSKFDLASKVRSYAFAYAASGHATESDFRSDTEEAKNVRYAMTHQVISAALNGVVSEGSVEATDGNLFETDDTAATAIAAAEKALEEAKRQAANGPKLNVEAVRRMVEGIVAEQTQVYRIEIKSPAFKIVQGEEARHVVFPRVLRAVVAGLNVMLVGPAGCGKTELGKQLAKALELGFGASGAFAFEHKLLGYQDASGVYQSTQFRRCFENGGLFLLDEYDASSPTAALSVNPALANSWQDFPDGMVEKHPNFRCVVAGNTYGNGADRVYIGRNQMDAATLDRFVVIPMDYDEKLERLLYGDNDWTEYVHKCRQAVHKLKLRHVVSMRALEQGHTLIAAGETRKDIEGSVLWRSMAADDVAKVKSAMGV